MRIECTTPPCPAAVGGEKPGISDIGTEAIGAPKASAAGAQPEPRTTATSCVEASVSAAIVAAAAVAAASASTVGSMGITLRASCEVGAPRR